MSPTPIRPLSGFPELLPAQRFAERAVIDSLARTFELHGFANIETRVVEPVDRLTKGGEIDKEVYVLRRLQADADDSDAGLALHFDLTVPFARYVLEHAGRLEFPFRRYQIQKAWRGERPQVGRYREFTQADIDVVAIGDLPFHHDVEVVTVMARALAELPLPRLSVQLNNRKLIQGFYRGLGIPDVTAAIRAIDKLDKLPANEVAALLVRDAGATEEQAARCLELATIRTVDTSFVARVESLGVQDEQLSTGLRELAAVVEGASSAAAGRVDVEANLRIARGLDYYTGTVVEIFMSGYAHLKSVGGGGRYDALASDGKTTYPGVGISFGISRTLVPLFADGVLDGSRATPSAVLVALVSEESRPVSNAIAARLRARGIACEVAENAQKFGRQIRYAERRGIPFVWFPAAAGTGTGIGTGTGTGTDTGSEPGLGSEGGDGSVRDIRSGDQQVADADTWTPPGADARPALVSRRPDGGPRLDGTADMTDKT